MHSPWLQAVHLSRLLHSRPLLEKQFAFGLGLSPQGPGGLARSAAILIICRRLLQHESA